METAGLFITTILAAYQEKETAFHQLAAALELYATIVPSPAVIKNKNAGQS